MSHAEDGPYFDRVESMTIPGLDKQIAEAQVEMMELSRKLWTLEQQRRTLTESQADALRELDETKYRFPSDERSKSFDELELLQLAESRMLTCDVRYRTFRRGYRLTDLGKKCHREMKKPNREHLLEMAKFEDEARSVSVGVCDEGERYCSGCGKVLEKANAWMTDGCPCNSPLGSNNMNETRWRLLIQLQQQQSQILLSKKAPEVQLPEPGVPMLCILCAYVKPWGVFDAKTGAAVCIECRNAARDV